MTTHDSVRRDNALAFKGRTFGSEAEEFDELCDVVRGLQSTDAPELMPLHDEMMERYMALKKKLNK
jgi:hypothetical protein